MADHGPIDTSEQIDDPVASSTWFVGIVGIFVFIAVVAATDALFRVVEASKHEKFVNSVEYMPRKELEDAQKQRLNSTGQMERPDEPGVMTNTMKIEDAIGQIVKENGG